MVLVPCRRCDALVWWATTAQEQVICLDETPDPELGRATVTATPAGLAPQVRILTGDEMFPAATDTIAYRPYTDTCTATTRPARRGVGLHQAPTIPVDADPCPTCRRPMDTWLRTNGWPAHLGSACLPLTPNEIAAETAPTAALAGRPSPIHRAVAGSAVASRRPAA